MKTMPAIFILMFVCVSHGFAYKYENTMKREFTVNPDAAVKLETLRGDIEISTYSGSEVKIKAIVMSDEKNELEKVKIKFAAGPDLVTASANGKIMKSKVNIDYYLKIPARLKSVHITTYSGEIKARGAYRDIDLNTTIGEIDFKGSFTGCKLKSANGDIDVYVKGALKGNILAETTNGSIGVELKPGSEFTIDGSTFTGSIRSDFETTITGDTKGSKIKGTFRGGTYNVDLKTINGNIILYSQ